MAFYYDKDGYRVEMPSTASPSVATSQYYYDKDGYRVPMSSAKTSTATMPDFYYDQNGYRVEIPKTSDVEGLYSKYNELVGNAEKRYAQTGYRADYSTWKDQTATSTSELSSMSKNLRRKIDSYRTIYGDEYADSMAELLDGIDKGLVSLNDAANNDYKVFSQFADENEYNAALSTYEMQQKASAFSLDEIEAEKKRLKKAKKKVENYKSVEKWAPQFIDDAKKVLADELEKLGYEGFSSVEDVERWESVLANAENTSYGKLDVSKGTADLEALKAELEKVTANRDRVVELRGNILQKNRLNLTENKVKELEKEVKALSLDGSADADTILVSYNKRVDELKKQISGLEKDLQSAGKVQSFNALGAVMDPTSEFYNPDFDKYVQEGASRFGNVVEGVKNGKTAEELGISKDDYLRYKAMTDEEVKLYNYYNSSYYDSEYHNSKKQKTLIGEQYIDELDKSFNSLTARAAQAYYNEVLKDKSDVEKIFSSVGANLERWGQNFGRALETYVVGSINPNHYGKEYYRGDVSQGASAIAREDLGALGKVAYDALGAASYMLPSIATSAIVGTVSKSAGAATFANALTMGVPIAGQAYEDMINLGYSEEQAKTYGILAGASEFTTELFLNGAGKGLGKAVEPFADSIGKVMGRFAIKHGSAVSKFIAQAGSEAVEEMVQEVLDPILRTIATGDLHDGATIEEMLYSGLLGGITAMGINTVDVAFNKVSQAVINKNTEAFTQNEQVVFDKIVENRIAELEAKGEKVTSAEKKNIKKSVRQEFENGEISTSDIEEALKDNWQPNVEQDTRIVQCYVKELEKKQAVKADSQKAYIKLEDFSDKQSHVWRNVEYGDDATKTRITQETHDKMVSDGAIVEVLNNVKETVAESYPDLRSLKKKDRTPILKEAMNRLKSNLRAFLSGFKNEIFEFEVNGKVLEAKLYNTGINEVLEKITRDKAEMLYSTEDIFSNARYLYSTPDYDGDPNVYRWNYFYTPVKIGDDTVGVRIAVRDTATPQESQIYNWGIKKDTSLDGVGRGTEDRISHDVSSDASNNNKTHSEENVNLQDEILSTNVSDELLTDEQLEARIETQEKATQLKLIQREIENNKKLQKDSKERFDKRIEQLQKEYDSKQNKNTLVANGVLRRIERQSRLREQNDLEYSRRIEQLKFQEENVRKGYTSTRKKRHQEIIESAKTAFEEKGFDFVEVLKNAKRLSTFSTVDNTPQRVMEKALGYKQGQILADLTVNKVAQNETEGIKWLNYYTDKKNGILAQISKDYNIKPGSKESAAAQMYAEGFYVNEMNEIVRYGDEELYADFPNYQMRKNIIGLSRDSRIRDIYNETLAAINESRKRNGYPEIKKLDNYFLHFRAMDDTFSKLGLPFNPNDIRAKDLPTDLNGVTADLKPGQPYFASAKHRRGKRTSFDLLGGLERYLSSAKNQIYHIDDIQTLRALRNYIADNYGSSTESFDYDLLAEETIRDRLKDIKEAHLSTFASFLNEEANVVAGKTPLIDRGVEGFLGRRAITTLNTINSQVGSNMVGLNVSSSLTNFLAGIQSVAKNNPIDSMKSLAETIGSRTRRLFGKKDAFVEENPTIIRRRGAERFYRTPYEKVKDVGYIFMSAVDDVTTEFIVRSKYNEFVRKGMGKQEAINEADKWTSRLMGDRSLGQQPQLYNSKTFGLFTKFQLEVRNQLDSQFYDTIKERVTANENIENALKRNSKTAAEVATTFVALTVLQHLFGKAFESVAGYNPAFDLIDVFLTALGVGDDEENDDGVLDNLSQAFIELLEDLPYASTFTGGRIPISSALPISQLLTGTDQYGRERARWKTLLDTLPWYILPTGFGQVKKSVMGGLMYDINEKRPIAGSYTFSGKLRFPVENDPLSFAQAIVFGQYSSSTARDYFDEGRSPLTDKQLNVFVQMGEDMTIQEYWDFLDEISAINKAKKKDSSIDAIKMKVEYIVSLDLPLSKKNILVNSILNRKDPVDLQGFGELSGFAEWDFSMRNPEKYQFLKDNGVAYQLYAYSEDTKESYGDDYQWYKSNPEKVTLSKAVAGTVVEYREIARKLNAIKADKDENGNPIPNSAKEKKIDYIDSLDELEHGAKLILYKDIYPGDDSVNDDIIEYVNGLDLTAAEKKTILKELNLR